MRPPPETPGFSADDVAVVRDNRFLVGLALSPVLLSLWALWAGTTVSPGFFTVVLHPLLLAAFALAFVLRRRPWPATDLVRVTVGADTVEIGAETVPIASFTGGFVLPGHRPRVVLRRRFARSIELRLGSTAEARSLLRALGLDTSQRVATFRTASRAVAKRRYAAGAVGAVFGVYGVVGALVPSVHDTPALAPAGGLFLLTSMVALAVLFFVPTRLTVGADGVVLRWFGRDRFIGYAGLKDVEQYDKGWGRSRQVGVSLTLTSGEEVLLPVGQPSWSETEVAIIAERIAEALEAFRAGDTSADAALLRRGGREVSAWLTSLRALGAGANADLRTAPVPRERLMRIVESPTASPASRAAAGAALGGALDDPTRERLRRAAEASAAPKLRVALEAAADGEREADLEAALGELEAAEAEGARQA